jgi:hypothetical protein
MSEATPTSCNDALVGRATGACSAAARSIGQRFGRSVSWAVAEKAEQPDPPGWDRADGLPAWERELVPSELEEVGELVGAGAEGW